MQDARLERTTDGQGQLRDYTLVELKTLNAAANHSGRDYGVQRIPTLQEAYDFVQGRLQINIEIKTDADGNRYTASSRKSSSWCAATMPSSIPLSRRSIFQRYMPCALPRRYNYTASCRMSSLP